MTIYLIFLTGGLFIILLVVAAISPNRSQFSLFELKRRSEIGDRDAARQLKHETYLGDIVSFQRAVVGLLLSSFVIMSIVTFGWAVGTVVAIIASVSYGALARLIIFRSVAQNLYHRLENKIIKLIKKYPIIFRLIRISSADDFITKRLGSSAELSHLVDESGEALSTYEKQLIVHSLNFSNQLVSSVMTPREQIKSIEKSEFLGPLVLDDLHKLGHSHLPVTDGGIDHIVGILNIKILLTLDIKRSTTAEKAMEAKVYYLLQDQTLQSALAAFLSTHHHLFIVVSKTKETVGILTMSDVMLALFGRNLVDDFDSYDSLRAVSTRKSGLD